MRGEISGVGCAGTACRAPTGEDFDGWAGSLCEAGFLVWVARAGLRAAPAVDAADEGRYRA